MGEGEGAFFPEDAGLDSGKGYSSGLFARALVAVHQDTGLGVQDIYNTWGLNQFAAYYETLVELDAERAIRNATAIRVGINAKPQEFEQWVESMRNGSGARRRRRTLRDKEITIEDVPTFDGEDDFDWETIDAGNADIC